MAENWPELEWSEWAATADTLHMWTQMVGKTRLCADPLQNHWWNVPLYVSARGLTTSPCPGAGTWWRSSSTSASTSWSCAWAGARADGAEATTVADFYCGVQDALTALGVERRSGRCRLRLRIRCGSIGIRSTSRTIPRRSSGFTGADPGGHGAEAVCDGVSGEDQPGAFLLGQLRPG